GRAVEQRQAVVRDREQRDVVAAGIHDEETVAADDDRALRREMRLAVAPSARRVGPERLQCPVLVAPEGDDLVLLRIVGLEIHRVQMKLLSLSKRPRTKESVQETLR